MSKTTSTAELSDQELTEDIAYFQEKVKKANHRTVDTERRIEWLNNSIQSAEKQLELHKDAVRSAEKQVALLKDAVTVYRV
jgi:predicted  nucleic acid-binding Zn-ribbon protein